MATKKTLFVLACCALAVSAIPQAGTIETDAEPVEPVNTGGGPVNTGGDPEEGDIPVIIIRRRPIFISSSGDDPRGIFDLLPNLFSTFFNRRPSFDPDFDSRFPESNSTTSNATRSGPGSIFTSLFGGLGPAFVPPEGDEMDMNSTHEVTVMDGRRVEVNRTTGGDKDGGFFFTRVLVNVLPMDGEGGGGQNGTSAGGVPPPRAPPAFPKGATPEDPRVNQEVTSSSPTLVRRKRWNLLNYLNSLRRRKTKPKSLPTCHDDDESSEIVADVSSNTLSAAAPPPPAPVSPRLPRPPTLEGDTNVNYIGPALREDNPDAEVFDVDLVRADAERFHARTSAPVMAQPPRPKPPPRAEPPRSQPIRSEPLRTQPIRAEPLRTQPIRAEPLRSLRSHPIRTEPLRSLRSQPIRAEPVRYLRSQPAVAEPLRSQLIMAEPMQSLGSETVAEPLRSLRSQPLVDESLRTQPTMAETLRSLRAQPAVAESLRSQAIRNEPLRSLRSQPALAESLRSQAIRNEPLRSLRSQPALAESLRSQPIRAEPLRSLRSQPIAADPLGPNPAITEPLRSSPLRQKALRSMPLETQVQRVQPTAPQLETREFRLPFKKSLRLL